MTTPLFATTAHFGTAGFDKRKLHALMQERGLDGILLTSPENVFYTTGYTTLPSAGNPILYTLRSRMPFFSYIDSAGEVTLLCWAFAAESVEFGADSVVGFNDHGSGMRALEGVVAERLGAGQTLGVESTCPYSVLQLLEGIGYAHQPPVVVDDVLNRLRLIKSPAEITLLERSLQIVEQSVAELYETLHLGMSRMDLTQSAKERMAHNGAGGMSHVTFSFSSANPEFAIHEPLERGSLVTLDLGGVYEGYSSDNRRYAYGGPVPASLQERYEAMVDIVDTVGAGLVPGATYGSLYQLALDRFAEHGIELLKRFTHTGHNIGIETEEQWLDDSPGLVVETGMVICIELYSIAETGQQIGDEETYVIEAAGPRRISVLPRELRVVE
jgi:Xaa-Pro aminopeptidase